MAPVFATESEFDLARLLALELTAAAREALGVEVDDALVRPSPPSQQGDFQSTLALSLGKRRKADPLELAQALAEAMARSPLCERPTVSGKGFVNFHLRQAVIDRATAALAQDPRLGVAPVAVPRRIVVDYSSPNVAKEMHVGHLRSTIIGDALCRLLEHLGHEVIRENHVGDWGTPFGMLVEEMVAEGATGPESDLGDLTAFYQQARARFDRDPEFAERARMRVVALQQGDPESVALWLHLRDISQRHFQAIYDLMDVGLTADDTVGESFYNPMLGDVVDELDALGMLTVSDGALCLFLPGYVTREGEPMPMIVRKRDGGFNYDTTDLAAIRHRLRDQQANAILYVVGAPQALHFHMLFDAARAAGWAGPDTQLHHVSFGSVLGEDGKMLRTRTGETVKLTDLLHESIARAEALLAERQLGGTDRPTLAHALGIGAIKYADLSNDRVRDYTFAFDRMLSFEGNTAAYLQYAHARVCSLLSKLGDPLAAGAGAGTVKLPAPEERALALTLLRFATEVAVAVELLAPHKLCSYLHDLAAKFSTFYEKCPIRDAEPAARHSRLVLSAATGRTLATGLDLLGIKAPRQL